MQQVSKLRSSGLFWLSFRSQASNCPRDTIGTNDCDRNTRDNTNTFMMVKTSENKTKFSAKLRLHQVSLEV